MYKSVSLDSLNFQTISATSVLISTTNTELKSSLSSKLTRCMAIIPTPNRPAKPVTSARVRSSINDSTFMMNTMRNTDKSIDLNTNKKFSLSRKQNSSELLDIVDNHSHNVDHNKNSDDDDSLFDTFICENFVPFSGTQPIDQWLDETEALFNRYKIIRKLRFKAIPLLQ